MAITALEAHSEDIVRQLSKLKSRIANLPTPVLLGITVFIIAVPLVLAENNKTNNTEKKKPENSQVQQEKTQAQQQNNDPSQKSSNITKNSQPTPNKDNKTTNTYNTSQSGAQTQSSSSQPYVYQKPQCSTTLRSSSINSLKQGYLQQSSRKSLELGAWYSNNYQLPTYTHQQYVDYSAQNQAWLDNYIAIEIANKNTYLNENWVCDPITRGELGV